MLGEGFREYDPEEEEVAKVVTEYPDGSNDEADEAASEAWLAYAEVRQQAIEKRMEEFRIKSIDEMMSFQSPEELDQFFDEIDGLLKQHQRR